MLENLRLLPKAWCIGNTTVRSPYRIKEALTVLSRSSLLGGLMGTENENEFAILLRDSDILTLSRLDNNPQADVGDMGRKWRAALTQLGFITPDINTLLRWELPSIQQYTITPNGRRLIASQNTPQEQECFLRALVVQQIPSPIERYCNTQQLNPLRIVLSVLNMLSNCGMEPVIKINEMASIIQLIDTTNPLANVIEVIRQYRCEEERLTGRARIQFQNTFREEASSRVNSQNIDTLMDYADTNFRYLKITGLFSERGRGICFAPHKRTLINQLLMTPLYVLPEIEYLDTFWQGASLPTDNLNGAIAEIRGLSDLLFDNGEQIELPLLESLSIQDLSQIRMQLEERWRQIQEIQYANEQAQQWQEIVQYLREFGNRNSRLIPRGEAPAYLEWILWRAFLAIDSLCNSPWEARRFRIDQDFHPISTAAGNGPDMIFEFANFVVVVEVTLTTSSRQEAAEGEPVRRHVANLVDRYEEQGKTVYGLFIANNIDTNTAETFRVGVWYRNDDSRLALRIVPLTIEQFGDLFEAGFANSGRLESSVINQLLILCRAESNSDAPEWKRSIERHISGAVLGLQ